MVFEFREIGHKNGLNFSTKPSPNNNSITSPSGSSPSLMSSTGSGGGGGVTQMFPLKLADKKVRVSLRTISWLML